MFDDDVTFNLQQELSEIPPEYQDAFRRTIDKELAESEQNRTDNDILLYLRGRRDDFKRGGFIRPDGRPGIVALSPEAMYEQALPELAQSSLGEPDDTAERRRTLIKIGVFACIALLFVVFAFRGRSQRKMAQTAVVAEIPVAEIGAGTAGETAPPIPPLPVITSIDDSLQTIGGLGGALAIGRPSAIELSYSRTGKTIALAIDPSKPTPKGELRYNETTMRSDNPVAVWLFGTVLNYAIGVPDSMVRNLAPGDRIILSTDTGASLRFVVTETLTGASYEAGRLLSQNRVGVTLFALPAATVDDVAYAIGAYDVSSEGESGQVVYEMGESFALGPVDDFRITTIQVGHITGGDLRIVVKGQQNQATASTIMLSLMAGREQTTAVEIAAGKAGQWATAFTLPAGVAGLPLLAELRALSGGELALVRLGEAPRLVEQLQISVDGAAWDEARAEAVLAVSVQNPTGGDVYLGPGFIQLLSEGGDAYELTGQAIPRLPTFIGSGETLDLSVTFSLVSTSAQVKIGADLWEVTGLPVDVPPATLAPTGRPPATEGG